MHKTTVQLALFCVLVVWLGLTWCPTSRFDEAFGWQESERDIQKLWGAYTPYYPVQEYKAPPAGCAITQVNILQRHGARFPTGGAAANIISAVQKLQRVHARYTHPAMAFLRSFEYDLGVADLVPFGALQSLESGKEIFERYGELVDEDHIPFVRASSGQRVVDSANNWTTGFAVASRHVYRPILNVILSEEGNDTLENHMCPNAEKPEELTQEWLSLYAPAITSRLNMWAPGAGLTHPETAALISMCAFHTAALATGSNFDTLSPFCDLFTSEEFAAFDYSADLEKYYYTGHGARLGRVQGVGYVNELLARLTRSAVRDHTQTNRTLDSDPATFPLDRTIYADFSHDNTMIAIVAALGLFRQRQPLSARHVDPSRTWRIHEMVPFAGRIVVEKLGCGDGEFVRVLVNDALQPVDFCASEICRLEEFVESQSYARSDGEGDWELCYS
ncbi:unnamed protein product [Mycena citricolor]|uniref:Phytase A n=1 Tax=Mycena citricolor TaxID=2018698 RepID=A0AAD2GZ24_9AGAR|nr:unnamed protein product [Mycena citricolor]